MKEKLAKTTACVTRQHRGEPTRGRQSRWQVSWRVRRVSQRTSLCLWVRGQRVGGLMPVCFVVLRVALACCVCACCGFWLLPFRRCCASAVDRLCWPSALIVVCGGGASSWLACLDGAARPCVVACVVPGCSLLALVVLFCYSCGWCAVALVLIGPHSHPEVGLALLESPGFRWGPRRLLPCRLPHWYP